MRATTLTQIAARLGVDREEVKRWIKVMGIEADEICRDGPYNKEFFFQKDKAKKMVEKMIASRPRLIYKFNKEAIHKALETRIQSDVAKEFGFKSADAMSKQFGYRRAVLKKQQMRAKNKKQEEPAKTMVPDDFGKGLYYTAFNALNIAARASH